MSNKLISTIMALSVMWALVKVDVNTGLVDDNGLQKRYINKASCEKGKAHMNNLCEKHKKPFRFECVSAIHYIPQHK